MGKETLIVENIGMKFNMSEERVDDLREYIIRMLRHDIKKNEFWALKDINFS